MFVPLDVDYAEPGGQRDRSLVLFGDPRLFVKLVEANERLA
jgi:hypothetical protein